MEPWTSAFERAWRFTSCSVTGPLKIGVGIYSGLKDITEARTAVVMWGAQGPSFSHREYHPQNILDFQRWADKANEIIMALESNGDVMSSLRLHYASLKENPDFDRRSGREDDIQAFGGALEDMVYDFKMQITRVKLLVKILNDRKDLVSELIPHFG